MNILGVFHSYSDPSAALVRDGQVVAFVEEERLTRVKHAAGSFPTRAIDHVLEVAGLAITDVDRIVQGWNCDFYDSGEMASVYEQINASWPTTPDDLSYQRRHLEAFRSENQREIITRELRRQYGTLDFPTIEFVPHHLAHACMAYFHSGMDDALLLTIDGSGESTTNAWWRATHGRLEPLGKTCIPHSLGWFYAALTEYLGFRAYDGEYKIMGLAAYGKPRSEFLDKVSQLIWYDGAGGFESNPMLLSRGARNYSYYYPDALIDHLGCEPRAHHEEITPWHIDLAYAVQHQLESIVLDMVEYWTVKTGTRRLAIAGGVGLNVKMNGRVFASGLVDEMFVHPLCADTGVSIGAAMAYEYEQGLLQSNRLRDVYLGPQFADDAIEQLLLGCKLPFTKESSIERRVAELLAEGNVVGWFQGPVEGGPRALGNRSILADPRSVQSRDRVNAVIKFREFWRPFCPSMTAAGGDRYLAANGDSRFMICAFQATKAATEEIPAVVHVDGSTRPQVVDAETNPCFHRLLEEFDRLTSTPCLLNTSFNVKGEPIVCTPHDAIRTFSATGLDALALGPFLITKSNL